MNNAPLNKAPSEPLSEPRPELLLSGCVWIAADIHLGPHNPATCRAFYRFLQQASQTQQQACDALILCGDIFHVWVGDDQIAAPQPWLAQAMQAMQAFSRAKPLYLMRGNRDFLLGRVVAHSFARSVGATLLPDALRVQTDGSAFWLTHGDELCTHDRSYQRFRSVVRNAVVQRLFLACPLRWRHGIANWFRRRSQRAGARKDAQIGMNPGDVNPAACRHVLVQQQLSVLVHGHTHRPAIHRENHSDASGQIRIVLPDWELDGSEPARSGWLSVNEAGLTLHQPGRTQTVAAVSLPVPSVSAAATSAATPTTAIVLAAGMSRRMGGQNKLLLAVDGQAGGQPMIRTVVERAVQAVQQACGQEGQVIVVLGHDAQPVQAALHGLPVRFVTNPDYAQGMGTSVRAGACAVPAGQAALVCLGDMPGVGVGVMQALIEAGTQAGTDLAACQPVWGDDHPQRGNPVWWAPAQLVYLRTLTGDAGARVLLQDLRAQGRVLEVAVNSRAIVQDIDTPQDWHEWSIGQD